jgi:hypothetical protein
MDSKLYMEFADFAQRGKIQCVSFEQACDYYYGYENDEGRRKREGIVACWVMQGDKLELGRAPAGWSPADPHYTN